MPSYSPKTIRTTVTLAEGTFTGGGNTKIIEGLPTEVSIRKPGLPEKNEANIRIGGVKLDDMAQMTMLAFSPLKTYKNNVTIQAGDKGVANLPIIFKGEVTSAFANFSGHPNIYFEIKAQAGSYGSIMPAAQESVQGTAAAADLIRKFALQAGYTFSNDGVTASVRNAVFNGSPMDKARAVANQVGCEMLIDDGAVIIIPRGETRKSGTILLRKGSGLLGYPSFNDDGISFRAVFNPDYKLAATIRVESIVPRSTGYWKITKLEHKLQAYTSSGGDWISSIDAAYLGA